MKKFYRASHILLSDIEDVEYVQEKLSQGESFESLAKMYSECDSAKDGGSLGQFSEGTMDAAFERALFQMKTGEISPPVTTKYGLHLIKKLDL